VATDFDVINLYTNQINIYFQGGKEMKAKKFLFAIFTLSLAMFVLAGCGEGNADEFHFNVSFAAPETSTPELVAALNRIQEASGDRIEMTYYFSWSLSSVSTIVDDLNAGIVDIGVVPIMEHTHLFPYSTLITHTPFLGIPSMLDAGVIFDEMFAIYDVLPAEFARNSLVYWTNISNPTYHIWTDSAYEIRLPSDLAGRRLITNSTMMQQFISRNGGAPVSAPVTEFATSINTGVVDGTVTHANVLRAFGVIDFIGAGTLFGEQGISSPLMAVVISESAWNSMPTDLQQLFTNESATVRDLQAQNTYQQSINNVNAIRAAAGDDLITLTPAEIQVWMDEFYDILEGHVEQRISDGATSAREMFDSVRARAAARQ